MLENAENGPPPYLTTKEVADLLRVKERKVYDLAAAGEIPHRRITGKLLFPSAEISAWIEGAAARPSLDAPAVLSGSHDPLLDWAVRESGSGLAVMVNGSVDGLDSFARRQSALTGLHLREQDDWNRQTVAARNLTDCVLIGWAVRTRGLLLSAEMDGTVAGFADLRGKRVVMRQPGAGATALFAALLDEAGMTMGDLIPLDGLARTEGDAAAAVAGGDADAALGIAAMARRFRLGFLPLIEERFDLLIDRRAYFTDPVQTLLHFARSDACRAKATAMGGYALDETGAVRWLSP